MSVGVFGRLATWETKLADGDRVEIYRPLQIDPKVARRMRVKKLRIVHDPKVLTQYSNHEWSRSHFPQCEIQLPFD